MICYKIVNYMKDKINLVSKDAKDFVSDMWKLYNAPSKA